MSAVRPFRPPEEAARRVRAALDAAEAALSALSPAEIPAVIGELARLRALLDLRLIAGSQSATPPPDRLLTAEQAATRLSLAPDTLYRKAGSLPFTVRLPGRNVRFSEAGLEKYIRTRQGR